MKPNVTTITEAAKDKGCTRQAIYNAIDRGDLDTAQIGGIRMVLKDAKYDAYQVKETGGRTHKAYQEEQSG